MSEAENLFKKIHVTAITRTIPAISDCDRLFMEFSMNSEVFMPI